MENIEIANGNGIVLGRGVATTWEEGHDGLVTCTHVGEYPDDWTGPKHKVGDKMQKPEMVPTLVHETPEGGKVYEMRPKSSSVSVTEAAPPTEKSAEAETEQSAT